jgi:hypothetical protein
MPVKKKRRKRRRFAGRTYVVFFLLFAALIFISHAAFLDLPLYWDEAGQFVPTALDLYHSGALIPRSVTPNAHPPGVMAYLAAVWTVTGYSILSTRAAMLLLGALAALVVFLLAIKLCAEVKGAPAFTVVLLLMASPIFYAQSMLAQLDMPAMLFTILAVLLFLEERLFLSALACVALVLVKETGIVTPLLLCVWLLAERRLLQAGYFLLAPTALGAWFLLLHHQTGQVFGSSEFTQYNVEYMQHPVRIAFALAKRIYFLFWEDLRFIGAFGILYALMRGDVFVGRGWRLAWILIVLHIALFSLLGGAMLERYVLPIVPLVDICMIAGLCATPNPWRSIGQLALIAGAVIGNFWNPPYPFPYENNLAFTEFVRLHQTAAEYIEKNYSDTEIATAWPASAELSKPELGYVKSPRRVREIRDFTQYSVGSLEKQPVELFVLFSRQSDPPGNLLRNAIVMKIWSHFFSYESQVPPFEIDENFHLKTVAAWSNHGQWIEVHARQ